MSINTASTKVLDIGEVLSDTFAVIGRSFVVLANLSVMLIAIPAAIRIAGAALTPVSPIFAILSVIGALATVVGVLLAYGVMFQVAMQDLHGQSGSTDGLFKTALGKFWPLLGLAIVYAVGIVLGSLLLIVPGIIVGLAWSVAMPALVLEDRGVFASIGRSAALTRGKRWSIFLLFFLVTLVTIIVELVLIAIFGGFHGLVSGQASITSTVLSSLLSVVTIPFGAVMSTALFDALRGREGYGAEAVAEVFA
jgi:hypothetical protein